MASHARLTWVGFFVVVLLWFCFSLDVRLLFQLMESLVGNFLLR